MLNIESEKPNKTIITKIIPNKIWYYFYSAFRILNKF